MIRQSSIDRGGPSRVTRAQASSPTARHLAEAAPRGAEAEFYRAPTHAPLVAEQAGRPALLCAAGPLSAPSAWMPVRIAGQAPGRGCEDRAC